MTPTALEDSQLRLRDARPRRSPFAKLRPGPGLTSAEVHADQRARLQRAIVELVADLGYERVTVRDLTRLANVSTRSFYNHFANVEECFIATYEYLVHGALWRAHAAQREAGGWEAGLRAALHSILEDLAGDPKQGRVVLVEAYALGTTMRPRMSAAFGGFERLLLDSFTRAPHEVAASQHLACGITAGVTRVARTRLLGGGRDDVAEVERELHDWILRLCDEHAPELQRPNGRPLSSNGHHPFNGNLLGSFGDDRGRSLAAVTKLALTGGLSSLTVPKIRAEAGVSRRRFDARFGDVADCFLEAVETLAVSAAASAERDTIAQTVDVLCAEVARQPALAQLVFVESLAAGQKGLRRQEHLISLAAEQLRAQAPGERPGDLVADASVAAAWRIVEAELEAGRATTLPRLAPLLNYALSRPGRAAEIT